MLSIKNVAGLFVFFLLYPQRCRQCLAHSKTLKSLVMNERILGDKTALVLYRNHCTATGWEERKMETQKENSRDIAVLSRERLDLKAQTSPGLGAGLFLGSDGDIGPSGGSLWWAVFALVRRSDKNKVSRVVCLVAEEARLLSRLEGCLSGLLNTGINGDSGACACTCGCVLSALG